MVRTQIQLTEEQAHRLQEIAAERRVSMAELVREGVEGVLRKHDLVLDDRRQRALRVVGRYHSGQHDIARKHDDYLAHQLWDEINENRRQN